MGTHAECTNMLKQQLRACDILDEKILNLYSIIAREAFVPEDYRNFSYSDQQIQLPHQQMMLTPLEEAQLLQSLALKGHETVLEIGTGSGFLTAMLSQLCKKVISIDYFSDFTERARCCLMQYKCNNVELYTGDASLGWLELAPYDVIVFSGAMQKLREIHRLQLLPGGKLFSIIGCAPVMHGQLHTLNLQKEWQKKIIFETNIPLLIDPLRPQNFVF